ncbi:kielin/chordin-like protein, partial [Arapaima gigas]
CVVDGQWHEEGSLWVPEDQPCISCTCDGRVSCTPVQCPQVQCQNPVSQAGECCPVCPRTCHFHDQVYENGAVFTIPTAQDKQCSCLDGVVSCHRMPLPLAHSCVHKDSVYTHQQTFTIRGWPTSNSCMVCTCWVGRIHCVDVFCPKLNCEDQVQDPEACCPRCREGRRGDNI